MSPVAQSGAAAYLCNAQSAALSYPNVPCHHLNRSAGGVLVGSAGEYAELDLATAAHVLVVDAS